ncbi:MAG: CHAT domain-containing protein, partial [Chitinophagaceae bacterium]
MKDTDNPLINELYKKWKQTKTELENQYALKQEARTLDIEFLEEKLREYEKNLYRYSDVKDSLVQWQHIRQTLSAGQAAIEFITFDEYKDKWTNEVKIAALVITPERELPQLIPLSYESQLFDAVKKSEKEADASYVNRLYISRGTEKLGKGPQESKSVYNLVWKPLEKYISGRKQLFLSLSGSLHKISFAALPFGKDSLLLDKFDIKYINSSADAGDRKHNAVLKRSVTLFGGVDYELHTVAQAEEKQETKQDTVLSRSLDLSASRGGSWKYLPGTLTETTHISNLFKQNGWDATLYTAKDANEQNMKGLTGNSTAIIHIATHGYFFPSPKNQTAEESKQANVFTAAENPLMRTGLLLAGGNTSWQKGYTSTGTNDGILT